MQTRFTVVIPTRERSDTLEWALKTCVAQEYENLEIIVSDNASTDRTEEVARSFADPRITYVNTGHRVSMTENFEFALSHVRGGYVTYIGDDDGLIPNALTELDTIIRRHRCRALIWPRQYYYWPGYVQSDYANTLNVNLFQRDTLREVNAAQTLRDVIAFRDDHYHLPSPYYGFIDHDVIRTVMAISGSFFHSSIPDIYASVAIASVLDTYHICGKAYALAGASRHSSGASVTGGMLIGVTTPALAFASENTLPFHPKVVSAPSIPLLVTETYLQAGDHLGDPEKVAVDMRQVLRAAIEDTNLLLDPALYQSVKQAVEQTATLHDLEEYARDVIAGYHYRSVPALIRAALRNIFSPNVMFHCERFGVTDIYGASLAFDRVLQQYRSPVRKGFVYLANYLSKAMRLIGLAIRPQITHIGNAVRARIAFWTKQ